MHFPRPSRSERRPSLAAPSVLSCSAHSSRLCESTTFQVDGGLMFLYRLYGLIAHQAFQYFRMYRGDVPFLKILVGILV